MATYGSKEAQSIIGRIGGGVYTIDDEVMLLNGLLALGYDPAVVAKLSDADPNRRYLGDAVTRALRAGVKPDDIESAIRFDQVARTEQDPVRRVQGLAEALGLDMGAVGAKAAQYGGDANAWIRAVNETPGAEMATMGGNRTVLGTDIAKQTFGQYARFEHATYTGKDVNRPAAPGVPAPPPGPTPIAPQQAPGAPGAPGGPGVPAPGVTPAPKPIGAPGGAGTTSKITIPDMTNLPKIITPQDAETFIREHFGYMGALLDIPDIHKILYGVADGSIAPDQFQNQLMGTDWYRNQNDAQIAWSTLQATHPGQADQMRTETVDNVKGFAVGLGFTLDDGTALEIANSALAMGWSPTQLRQAVSSHYQYQTGTSAVSGLASTLKDTAADFLLPMSDATITQWGQQLISGTATIDDFKAYAREQARGQYPGLGAWLDADPSRTVKQYVEPYAQQASQILEIPPDTIDFTNPKYSALFGKLDPKTGERSIMNGPEWAAYLKQQPDWQYTNNARDTVASLTDTLVKTFGQVG